jgi:hypothetical protein
VGDNYQSFILQTETGLHPTDETWAFAALNRDLVCIKKSRTESGTTIFWRQQAGTRIFAFRREPRCMRPAREFSRLPILCRLLDLSIGVQNCTPIMPTLSFRLLYGLLILGHCRRQILWLEVTTHPTAE